LLRNIRWTRNSFLRTPRLRPAPDFDNPRYPLPRRERGRGEGRHYGALSLPPASSLTPVLPGRERGGLRLLMAAARGMALLACLLMLGGCAGVKGLHESIPEAALEWPLGNDGARIVWVKTISDFKDLGIGQGFWERAVGLVTGGEPGRSIVRPYGVLHDAAGRLYIADTGAGVVHCIDIVHGRYSYIGGAGTGLSTPIGLAEDDKERLYISDSASGMVYRYDPRDRSLAPFLLNRLRRPTGIVFNPVTKLIYISDTLDSQVVAVDLNGKERRRLGRPEEGADGFNRPTDLAVDWNGHLLVTDSLNFRISVLTPNGELVRQFGAVGDAKGYFSRPKGIGVDRSGNTYVCDALRDAVQVFDPDGNPLLVFGKGGDERGRFWMPSGLYVDSSDYIFVADTYNKRIQVFRYVSSREADSARD
jgi:DNA-binding beta-propeller fold protein YncE